MTIPFEEFQENPDSNIKSFSLYGGIYTQSEEAKKALNKMLETEYVAVYRFENITNNPWKEEDDDIDWCAENFYVITKKGRFLCFSNSEWGGVGNAYDEPLARSYRIKNNIKSVDKQ